MRKNIVIIGSTNTDMVVNADHIPVPGETILGGDFFMNPGGKGANQAVAAARLGSEVVFIAKTGNDLFGKNSIKLFEDEGIDVSYVWSSSEHPSGVALITVSKDAENSIVVAPGANAALSVDDIKKAYKTIENADILLTQLEIPIDAVNEAVKYAHDNNVMVVLNPAPACQLPDELLECVDIITPNETEASILTGISVVDQSSAEEAAKILRDKGIKTVIVTLGSQGALVSHEDQVILIPALKVEAKDTTAAGDVFNGALVTALTEGKEVFEAVKYACQASAISVTRLGAQSSAPYKQEVNESVV